MRRARVTAVNGLKAQADGKWLNIMGNKMVAVGDFVWTDGRCIYGNSYAGGETAPIIKAEEPYVPILLYDGSRAIYHKGKIKRYSKGQSHKLMVSRENSFDFADGKVLDLHLEEDGDQYVLQWGAYHLHDYGDETVDEFDGEPGIIKNGQMIQPIDLKAYSIYSYDYAWEEVKAIRTPLYGIDDEVLSVYQNYCMLNNGWYESADSYCYLLYCYADGCHIDAINYQGEGEADLGYAVDFNTGMWVMVTPDGACPLWAGAVREVAEEWNEERNRYRIYAESFILPLPDGYYIEGTKKMPDRIFAEYNWWDMFSGKLYSPQGKLICESFFNLRNSIRLGYVKKGTWLIAEGNRLSRIKTGKKKFLATDIYNSRLRPMKNFMKWIKGDE